MLNDQTSGHDVGTEHGWSATGEATASGATVSAAVHPKSQTSLWQRPEPRVVYLIAALGVIPAIWYLLVGPGGVYVSVNGEKAKVVWHLGGMMLWLNDAPPRWVDLVFGLVQLAIAGAFAMRWRAGWIALLVWVGLHLIGTGGLPVMLGVLDPSSEAARKAVDMAKAMVLPSLVWLVALLALMLSPWVRGVFWPSASKAGQ